MMEIEKEGLVKHSILWCMEKKWWIINSFFSLLLIFAVLWRFLPFHDKQGFQNLTKSYQTFLSWKQAPDTGEKYQALKSCLKGNLFFDQKFHGVIGQELLLSKFPEEGRDFLEKEMDLAEKTLPSYIRYSKIAVLISKGAYSQALSESIHLKREMLNDPIFLQTHGRKNSFIFAMNLFRIALLEKTLSHDAAEMESLSDLQSYIEKNNTENPESSEMNEFLKIFECNNKINLNDYINYRKEILRKASK